MERDWVFGNVVYISTVTCFSLWFSGVSVSHVANLKLWVFLGGRLGLCDCSGVLSFSLRVNFALLSPSRVLHQIRLLLWICGISLLWCCMLRSLIFYSHLGLDRSKSLCFGMWLGHMTTLTLVFSWQTETFLPRWLMGRRTWLCSAISQCPLPHPIQTQHKSFYGQVSSSSRNVQSHHLPHFLDPSLRINSGTTQPGKGLANRERGVADCTSPPSSRGNVESGEIGQTQGGDTQCLMGKSHRMMELGGGNLPSGSGTRGCPIPGTGDYVINLTYDGHLTVHQVDQHMLVEELATEAAHVYVFPI